MLYMASLPKGHDFVVYMEFEGGLYKQLEVNLLSKVNGSIGKGAASIHMQSHTRVW